MVKRISALATGLTLIAMATVVPVLAQSDTATTEVEVDSFLEFAIFNPSGDACATAGGDCPFGTTSGTILDNQLGYDSAYSAANTVLRLRTNNTLGASVSAYGTNADADPSNCLVAGTDVITDTIADLPTAQAANAALTDTTDTGLAFRLLDTGTAAALRGTDEDTQWGDGDAGTALWASFPMTSTNAEVIYDTDVEQTSDVDAVIRYFAGVAGTQPAGNYSCVANFEAAANV